MERFTLSLPSTPCARADAAAALCGVVSSGNLEILVDRGSMADHCDIEVNTSAHGFRDTWEAVLTDAVARHAAGGLALAINDAGATPAVVSLRLDQALEALEDRA